MQAYQKKDSNLTGILRFDSSNQVQRNTDICLETKQSSEIKATLYVRTNYKIKFICIEVYWKVQLCEKLGFQIWINALKSTVCRQRPSHTPQDTDLFDGGKGPQLGPSGSVVQRYKAHGSSITSPFAVRAFDSSSATSPHRTKNLSLTEIPRQLREGAAKNGNVWGFFHQTVLY